MTCALHPGWLALTLFILVGGGAIAGFMTFALIPGKTKPSEACSLTYNSVGGFLNTVTYYKGGDATNFPRNTNESISAAIGISEFTGATLHAHITRDLQPILWDPMDTDAYLRRGNREGRGIEDIKTNDYDYETHDYDTQDDDRSDDDNHGFDPSQVSWAFVSGLRLNDGFGRIGNIPHLTSVLTNVCNNADMLKVPVNMNIHIADNMHGPGIQRIAEAITSSRCNVPIRDLPGSIMFSASAVSSIRALREYFPYYNYRRPLTFAVSYDRQGNQGMGLFWKIKTRWNLYFAANREFNAVQSYYAAFSSDESTQQKFSEDGYCIGAIDVPDRFQADQYVGKADYITVYQPPQDMFSQYGQYDKKTWVWGLLIATTVILYVLFVLSIIWTVCILLACDRGLND